MENATPVRPRGGTASGHPRGRVLTLLAAVAFALAAGLSLAGAAAGATPQPLWATQAGAALGNDRSSGIAALADGSSIVTGEFSGTATFGPFTLQSAGDTDIFVARMNPDGSFAWATRAGGTGEDVGAGVSALADGSSLITGSFSGGPVAFGATSLTSAGGTDVFVARVTADGAFAWAARAGGPTIDRANGVYVLPDGSSVITGFFQGGPADFGGTALTGDGQLDAFVARVNANGVFAWATQVAGALSSEGTGVSALADGSSIVAGYFYGTGEFGGIDRTSAGNGDAFVARVNANGAFAWVTRAGAAGDDGATGVSALTDGSSMITGYFRDTVGFGATDLTSAGLADVVVARVNPNGTFASAARAGGAGSDVTYGISALPDGSGAVAGEFYGSAGFGAATLTSVGDQDVFVARFDAAGAVTSARRAGGTGTQIAFAVTARADGSMAIAGRFSGGFATGPFSLVASPDHWQAFVARYVTDVPAAPTGVGVSLADTTASVGFTRSAGGVAASYTATCASSTGGETRGATGNSSPLSVGGLTVGATYTCTVIGTNPIGDSPPSAPSAPFTVPAAQPPAGAPVPTRTTLGIRTTAPARALVGTRITYVIRVRNRGRVVARNVVLTDRLPAGLAFVRATPRSTVRARTVTVRLGRILPGTVRTVRITVRHSGAAGRKVNTVSAKAANSTRVRGVARTVFRSPAGVPPARG